MFLSGQMEKQDQKEVHINRHALVITSGDKWHINRINFQNWLPFLLSKLKSQEMGGS